MVGTAVFASKGPSAAEAERLVNAVHEVMRSVVHRLQPALEVEGISTGQFWSLHVVSSLQSASLSAVARHLSVSAPTVCATVDQLEAAGLVTRHRSDRDRRAVELSLTPKGRRVESRVWSRIGRLMHEVAEDLPPEELATAVRVFLELQRRLESANHGSGESS
ncbi:MAG TPA: MarR family winged helix-turn-helix transcriptional regulator [Thermoplasmata archaeon]|nr:MarR family winged helix-turn-helix transcriptional regulator [Thermoplasmata archaeon]